MRVISSMDPPWVNVILLWSCIYLLYYTGISVVETKADPIDI